MVKGPESSVKSFKLAVDGCKVARLGRGGATRQLPAGVWSFGPPPCRPSFAARPEPKPRVQPKWAPFMVDGELQGDSARSPASLPVCGCRAPPCALESAQLQIDKLFVTALGRRLCGWRSRQSPRHNCQPATNRCVSRWQVWIGHRNPRCGSLLSQRSTQIVLQRRNASSAGVAPAGAKRRATALSLRRRPVTAVGALLDSCSPTPLSH